MLEKVIIMNLFIIQADRQRASFGKEIGVHQLYIDAVSVMLCDDKGQVLPPHRKNTNASNHSSQLNLHQNSSNIRDASTLQGENTVESNNIEYSQEDIHLIRYISNHPTTFSLLVASLCPEIYGHNLVKAGLILGLLGGTNSDHDLNLNLPFSGSGHVGSEVPGGDVGGGGGGNKEENMPVRSDIHVLIVGDPGLGKVCALYTMYNSYSMYALPVHICNISYSIYTHITHIHLCTSIFFALIHLYRGTHIESNAPSRSSSLSTFNLCHWSLLHHCRPHCLARYVPATIPLT